MLTAPIVVQHHNKESLRSIVKAMSQARRDWEPSQHFHCGKPMKAGENNTICCVVCGGTYKDVSTGSMSSLQREACHA